MEGLFKADAVNEEDPEGGSGRERSDIYIRTRTWTANEYARLKQQLIRMILSTGPTNVRVARL